MCNILIIIRCLRCRCRFPCHHLSRVDRLCECVDDKIQLKSHNNSFSSGMWLITNELKIGPKFIFYGSVNAMQHMNLSGTPPSQIFIYLIGQCR